MLAFSVLLSIRRCTLPGGKTPTRSRAHPSSTLARLYTQGVHTTTVIPTTPYGAFPLLQSHPPASFTPLPKPALFEPLSNHSTLMKSPPQPPPLPYNQTQLVRFPNRLERGSRDRFYSLLLGTSHPTFVPALSTPLNGVHGCTGARTTY